MYEVLQYARRRFYYGLFLRALRDMTGARVQLLVNKHTRRGLTAWSNSSISPDNRVENEPGAASKVELPILELVLSPFRLFYSPRAFSLVLSRRIGTAGVCSLSARVMSGCLKLPHLRGFCGQ